MKNIFTIFLFFISEICFGQNLVPNWSFEDTIICSWPTHWNFRAQSPDYLYSCYQSVPNNTFGYQAAYNGGNAYLGLYSYVGSIPNYREIAGEQLFSPLAIGQRYYVSMKVSKANCLNGASNNLGMFFSCDSVITYFPIMPFNHSQFVSSSVITDTLNWVTISGSFIADSAYKFIYIGNFFDDAHTDTLITNILSCIPDSFYCDAYYYIDNVCVSTDSLTCNSSVAIQQIKKYSEVSLFPNPFSNRLTFTLPDNEQAQIILYDIIARKIFQQTFTNVTTVNTEHFPHGIYFYEVRNKNGISKIGKVIKQ